MATTGKSGGTATENPKTVSRKEPGRSATTGKDGDNRHKKSQRGKEGMAIFCDPPFKIASEMLQHYRGRRKDRPARTVVRTKLFRSDKAA